MSKRVKKAWSIYCELPLENSLSLKYYKLLKKDDTLVICPKDLKGCVASLEEEGIELNFVDSREALKKMVKTCSKSQLVYLQADPLFLLLNKNELGSYKDFLDIDKYYKELLRYYGVNVITDRLRDYNNESTLVYLMDIMKTLRSDRGCPWDRKQTHESLKPYIIEEAYEVLEAIDHNSMEELCEELGDLLLQVIFQTSLAEEKEAFYIEDVIRGLEDKILRRHPHVFGEDKADNVSDVMRTWAEVKKKEKKEGENKKESENLSISKHLPALLRAEKMQAQAKKVGFDWKDAEGALNKMKEELKELEDAYRKEKKEKIEEEVGDVLFSVVNVSRFYNISPEIALNKTNDKFYKRFVFIEESIGRSGVNICNCDLEDLDKLWEKAKKSGF